MQLNPKVVNLICFLTKILKNIYKIFHNLIYGEE